MSSQEFHPKWWQLYLIFPLLIALFMLDNHLKLSTLGHQVVQIGILLLVFGLICLWLRGNANALSKMDRRQDHGRITVIRITPSQLSDAHKDKRPMFILPNSEIKGVLSDTFEMDVIDAEFYSVDNVTQDSKKD